MAKQKCGDFWADWPEYTTHTPEKLAAMKPSARRRGEAHIAKMREKRDRYTARLREVNAKHAAGVCYCDDEYLCPAHAEAFRRRPAAEG